MLDRANINVEPDSLVNVIANVFANVLGNEVKNN
jgi:hypothetical protein